MKLIYDSEHDNWQFRQGETGSVIPLDGERFFQSREQAISTARQVGLSVDKAGHVAVGGRSTPAAASVRKSESRTKASRRRDGDALTNSRRRITLWLDCTSIDRLDQLAQSHGSRGDAVDWLLTTTTPPPKP
jgi:hypothetical protein